tara:strand:+ start:3297 stop:4154 length:858 start_codon:yes stop_codon:yes gene_type:complete
MTNQNVSVAFLMALYKSDLKLLERSLQSIFKQTYDGQIVIYCILDGKNNLIHNFLKEYSENNIEKNRQIKIYTKLNSGTADTRNYGLSKIKEDYVFIQDDDDFSLPERVNLVLEQFNRNNKIQVIASSAIFKLSKANGENSYQIKNYPNKKLNILFSLIIGENPICQPTICFKINDLCNNLGIDKKNLYPRTITEDQSLWYFLALKNIFVYQISFPSVIYTIRKNQYSQNIFKYSRVSSIYFLKESIRLLNHNKKLYLFFPLILLFILKRILIIKAYVLKLKLFK